MHDEVLTMHIVNSHFQDRNEMPFIGKLFSASCLKNGVYTHSVLLVWHMITVFCSNNEMHCPYDFRIQSVSKSDDLYRSYGP